MSERPSRTIRTPDQRLRVFVSSTLQELAEERAAVRRAVEGMRLSPVMFELRARSHPPRELYRAYLQQSHVFVGIYWQSYGWVAPGEQRSGLEDEYRLSGYLPKLIYIKEPAPEREPGLKELLATIKADDQVAYKRFSNARELEEFVAEDLALLLTEQFEAGGAPRPAAVTDAGSAQPTSGRLRNLPVPPTTIVGRSEEMQAVEQLILQDDVSLVTLTGPGGTGKTRLALEVAWRLLDRYTDGAVWVQLAAVRDPSLVASTIATDLGVKETPGVPLKAALAGFLGHRHMLLVLDNFEQVVEAATVVGELLEASPRLDILVSSRTPLRLRREREFPVPPLRTPGRGEVQDTSRLSQYASVELFIQRAVSVNPDFVVTNETAPAVAEICCRLDGLPLAIELAAARSRLLPPPALLRRLDHRIETLRGGARDLPPRQQTLKTTIDWSFQLLEEPAKELFQRLAVFSGGWTLEAAEAICDPDGDLGGDLLDGMAALIDASLVKQVGGPEGEPRFGVLQTIREFASELPPRGDEDALARRHAEYYLALAQAASIGLRSAQRRPWIERLEQEHDNCRAAMAWSLSPAGDLSVGEQLVGHLSWFWEIAGHHDEGREWMGRFVAAGKGRETPDYALMLGMAGAFSWLKGDLPVARSLAEEAVALARRLGDEQALAANLTYLGLPLLMLGQPAAARQALEESIHLLRSFGNRWSEALSLNWLADALLASGEEESARQRYEESLGLWRQVGDPWGVAIPLCNLGWLAARDGDLARAEAMMAESVQQFRDVGDRYGQAWAESALGLVRLQTGRLGEAEATLREALSLAAELHNPTATLESLAGLAGAIAGKDPKRAARLLGAADRLVGLFPTALWYAKMGLDQMTHVVSAVLDENTFQRERAAGRSLTTEQAVLLALEETGARGPAESPAP